MSYKDFIDNLKPVEYSKIKDITSYEKLMLYATNELEKNSVPLTFNYICIASFKLFPDKFCCDEEFKEFPSIDRLNRTYMHLKYVKKGKSYIAGTMKEGFALTKLGKAMAAEVESLINSTKIDESIKPIPVDSHKKGSSQYYSFIEDIGFKEYLENKSINLKHLWRFFDVAPFTKTKIIQDNLELILKYAEKLKNQECIDYVKNLKKMI